MRVHEHPKLPQIICHSARDNVPPNLIENQFPRRSHYPKLRPIPDAEKLAKRQVIEPFSGVKPKRRSSSYNFTMCTLLKDKVCVLNP